MFRLALFAGFLLANFAGSAETGSEDVVPGVHLKQGDVIGFSSLEKLKDFLPPEF